MKNITGLGLAGRSPAMGVMRGGGNLQLFNKISNICGSSLLQLLLMSDLSGTSAKDYSGRGNNGLYVGSPTLNQDGYDNRTKSVLLNGTSQKITATASDVIANLTMNEFTMFGLSKVSGAGIFTDGISRTMFRMIDSGLTWPVGINKTTSNYQLSYRGLGGAGTLYTRGTGWHLWGLSGSISNNRLRLYCDGAIVSKVTSGLSSSALSIAAAYVGSATSSQWFHSGNVGLFGICNKELSETQMEVLQNIIYKPKRMSFIGDSISTYGWPSYITTSYRNEPWFKITHAVVGAHIVENNDGIDDFLTQVAAAANDDADLINIEMGTNDDNAGNMTTLQNVLETGLATLKTTNPRALIQFVNIPPRWTNVGGSVPIDKSNIRSAIVAGCAAKTITCIDTFASPVWTAADTIDGTHPADSGSMKLGDRTLANMPA